MGDTSSYRRQAGQEVIDIVCKARNKAYGDAEDNFANIAEVMTTILRAKLKEGERITAVDVSALSVAIKVGRLATDVKHEDSWLDLAGYALCALGILRADRARGFVPSHSKDAPLTATQIRERHLSRTTLDRMEQDITQAQIDEAFKLLEDRKQ
jgi:hypothetical protein